MTQLQDTSVIQAVHGALLDDPDFLKVLNVCPKVGRDSCVRRYEKYSMRRIKSGHAPFGMTSSSGYRTICPTWPHSSMRKSRIASRFSTARNINAGVCAQPIVWSGTTKKSDEDISKRPGAASPGGDAGDGNIRRMALRKNVHSHGR